MCRMHLSLSLSLSPSLPIPLPLPVPLPLSLSPQLCPSGLNTVSLLSVLRASFLRVWLFLVGFLKERLLRVAYMWDRYVLCIGCDSLTDVRYMYIVYCRYVIQVYSTVVHIQVLLAC